MTTSSPRPRHWARIGESTCVSGIWTLYWVHRLLGRWIFLLGLYPVALCYWLAQPATRAHSLQYLTRLQAATGAVGHHPGRIDTLRHVALFAETLLDKLLAASGRYRARHVAISGSEMLYQSALAGRGGVIVTAHLGCLELCRSLSEQRIDFHLNILVHTRHAQQFNRILQQLNPDSRVTLIEVSDVNPATAAMLALNVAAGEFVAIAGDRVPVTHSKTVQVEFLGHSANFPVGPYVLASIFHCPLYFLGSIHQGRGYAIHFECLTERVDLPRATRDAALTEYAADYVRALTALLRRSPYDWFNFYPFWNQAHVNTAR